MNINVAFSCKTNPELFINVLYIQVGSKEVRARQYPWGVVQVIVVSFRGVKTLSEIVLFHYTYCPSQVENENHCDFTKLREMLIRTNMEDLCDSTHSRHYELYRKERLKQMGFEEGDKEGKVKSSLIGIFMYVISP